MKPYVPALALLTALTACGTAGTQSAASGGASATLAEANPYVQAAAKSVAKAKQALPGLTSIAWSDLEYPEQVSFSGTGQHATAVFADGTEISLGDVVVENYLGMTGDVFATTVQAQLDKLLKREIDRRSGTVNPPPVTPGPGTTPGSGGNKTPDVAVNAQAAEQDPYAAGADAAVQRAKSRLPGLRSVAFSELSADAIVSFSGTGQHATAVFSGGKTLDLGDVVVENYMTMPPLEFATVVYRQLATALDKVPAA